MASQDAGSENSTWSPLRMTVLGRSFPSEFRNPLQHLMSNSEMMNPFFHCLRCPQVWQSLDGLTNQQV